MFGDDASLKKIMSFNSPGEMKALGSKINNFNAVIWTQSAPQITNECHHAKFNQSPALADYLLATERINSLKHLLLIDYGALEYQCMTQ